ncbi:trehalose operon repressor [Numidum massiliense]|uniref:trehalose operon repressor n=1 Tax=Numidum massiliense TaxID=1522315 RepID=UPI0006D5ACDC|nr:trehalose operon repressor [Numidum massiliense]
MKRNKYLAIFAELADQIEIGHFQPHTTLPSENQLAETYGASRETIRKALNLLAQEGYIQKVRGKGSVVLDIKKWNLPVSGLVSFKELTAQTGLSVRTLVHELTLVKADPFLQKQLKLAKRDEVWKVVRVREVGGERVILDKDYFNRSFVPTLTKDVCEDSIYEHLERDCGLQISFAKKEIVVEEATTQDEHLLDLERFSSIVVVKSHVYLNDASMFQYNESRHRPDKFRFVDFARRGHFHQA